MERASTGFKHKTSGYDARPLFIWQGLDKCARKFKNEETTNAARGCCVTKKKKAINHGHAESLSDCDATRKHVDASESQADKSLKLYSLSTVRDYGMHVVRQTTKIGLQRVLRLVFTFLAIKKCLA